MSMDEHMRTEKQGPGAPPPLVVHLDNAVAISANRRVLNRQWLRLGVTALIAALLLLVPAIGLVLPWTSQSLGSLSRSLFLVFALMGILPILVIHGVATSRAIELALRHAFFGRGPGPDRPFLVLDAAGVSIAHSADVLTPYPYSSVVLMTTPGAVGLPGTLDIHLIGQSLRVPVSALSTPVPQILQADASFRRLQLGL